MGESAESVSETADGQAKHEERCSSGASVRVRVCYLVEGRVHCPQLRQPAVGHVTYRVCGREDGHGLQ